MVCVAIVLFSMLSCAACDQQKQRITILPGVYLNNNFIRGEKVITLDVPSTQTMSVLEAWLNIKKGKGNLTVGSADRPLFDSNNLVDSNDRDMYQAIMPTYGSDTLSVLCEKLTCTTIAMLKFRFVFDGEVTDERPVYLQKTPTAAVGEENEPDLFVTINLNLFDSGKKEAETFDNTSETCATSFNGPEKFVITSDLMLKNIDDQLNKKYGKGNLMVTCPIAINSTTKQDVFVQYRCIPFQNYCAYDNVVALRDKIHKIGLNVTAPTILFTVARTAGDCPVQ